MDMNTHRFRVYGIDRETELETELTIESSTEANARAKAELRGMVVTNIQDLDKPIAQSGELRLDDQMDCTLSEEDLFTPAKTIDPRPLTDQEMIQEQTDRLIDTYRRPFPENSSDNGYWLRLGGGLLFGVGAICLIFFSIHYDTTVSVNNATGLWYDKRVHNDGLMQNQMIGVIVGIGSMVLGLISFLAGLFINRK